MTARIPPLAPADRDERTEALLATFRRSPDGPDMGIFATLAHHPKLLKKWSDFGGVLLYGGVLSGRDRELLILRTGFLCGADYEWGQHVVIGKACGLSDDEILMLTKPIDQAGWSAEDAALIRAADELHVDYMISDATWASLVPRYEAKGMIEICMVVGQYHLVAFTLNSLGVELDADIEGLPGLS